MTKKVDITQLRRDRADIAEKVQNFADLEAGGTELSAEQIAEFDSLQKQFDEIGGKITRAEAAEKMSAATAVPVDELESKKATVHVEVPKVPEAKGAKVSKMVRALAQSNGDPRGAAHIADQVFKDNEVSMALNTTNGANGGILVPQHFMPEVIELLRPKSVVRASGAITLPMPGGNLTIPKLSGGATTSYIGADDNMPKTEQTFGDLQLTAKKLAALVPITNDLIQYSGVSQSVDQMVINDLTASLGAREDQAFIRDDGTGNLPKGLRHWAAGANVVTANATVNVQNIEADLGLAMLGLRNANVLMINCGWIMNWTTYTYLEGLRDGNGNKVWPELKDFMLKGYPVRCTTTVPDNLGAGTNESEIYFCDFSNAIIGEADSLEIAISREATYHDGTELVSAFSKDQTLVRVIEQHDFGMRHDQSVSVITGAIWR